MRIEWIEKYLTDAERMMYDDSVEDGLALLNNLLYEEPGYSSLHNHLGWAYLYYTADVSRAERHLKCAIAFETDFAPPYLHLGNLYIRTARYNEALVVLEKGLTKPNANRVAVLEGIAHSYELIKEYGKAIATYKEAMASSVGREITNFTEGIKRCRKKRWVMMFTF
jgi:tetratricopeptide (TPR) repeat protein